MPNSRASSPTSSLNLPTSTDLSKICIIVDTSLFEEETFMKPDSIIFYQPLSLSLEECQTIAGNMSAIYDILITLQKSSIPLVMDTAEYKAGIVRINKYFVVLSGPTDMSNETMTQQVQLFVDAMILFLGPLGSLHLQFSADQIRVMIKKVARHIVNFVIPDRGVTFRNNVGYLPRKSGVPVDCLLRCSMLLDSLPVYGGVVYHDKKIVYTNLNSCVLSVIQGVEEKSIPVNSLPALGKATVIRVFLTSKLWESLAGGTEDKKGEEEEGSGDEMLDLQGLDLADTHVLNQRRDSLTPIVNSFEVVSLDIPEDEFTSSRPFLRSLSSQHSKFSLLNELFDKKKEKELKRSATIANITYETFQDSLESQASGSELPGNSLNYKLMTRDEDPVIPSPPSVYEAAPDSPQVIAEAANRPSDSNSGDSAYHDTLEYFHPYLCDGDLKVCELLVQSRGNTTVILIGDLPTEHIQEHWSTCLLLLSEVGAFFNMEIKAKPQKTTKGVNSFVFNKLTKTLLYSNAGKTSSDSHQQIKSCKEWCDDESDIDVICVKGLNCSTVVKNTSTANVFLTSHSMRCSKLADSMTDITGRNFDSVFL